MTKSRDLADNSQNTKPKVIDAKGDLIVGTGADAADRLAVGANGYTLVADSSQTTGLGWANNFAAGKNKIINGDFGIWQRGTSFTPATGTWTYTADRFQSYTTFSAGTFTVSRQAFTAGSAPVAGYESQYFVRYTAPTTPTDSLHFRQLIEDVRTFAGQTVTLSFWIKASNATAGSSMNVLLRQNFGSGGSTSVDTAGTSVAVTTSWTRVSATITLPSIAGKTIGTNSALEMYVYGGYPSGYWTNGATVDFWGWQLEAGSVATAFQTATGTIQGEFAACQRYYYRQTSGTAYGLLGLGTTYSSTIALIGITPPVTMRIIPTAIESSTLSVNDSVTRTAVTSATLAGSTTPNYLVLNANVASGLTGYRPIFLETNNSATGYVAFTAEL